MCVLCVYMYCVMCVWYMYVYMCLYVHVCVPISMCVHVCASVCMFVSGAFLRRSEVCSRPAEWRSCFPWRVIVRGTAAFRKVNACGPGRLKVAPSRALSLVTFSYTWPCPPGPSPVEQFPQIRSCVLKVS